MIVAWDKNKKVPIYLSYTPTQILALNSEDTKSAEIVNGQAAWLASIAHGLCFLQVSFFLLSSFVCFIPNIRD